jgi:hypothetical protein
MIQKLLKSFPLILALVFIIMLAGCNFGAQDTPTNLQSLGPAPELANEIWLNTDQPLRLSELRGSVVLLEMWTYG